MKSGAKNPEQPPSSSADQTTSRPPARPRRRKQYPFRKFFRSQGEQIKFAARGVLLATKSKMFWVAFAVTFTIFGTLMNLLSGGLAAVNLMLAVGFPGSLKILADAFLKNFGFGNTFLDWIGIFAITVLQSLLIGTLVVVLKKQKRNRTNHKLNQSDHNRNQDNHEQNKNNHSRNETNHEQDTSAHLQNSGLIAGLALIGSGCPTCGTALLTPLLTTIFSTGGVAIAARLSAVLTVAAVLLALWTLKKVGYDAYVACCRK